MAIARKPVKRKKHAKKHAVAVSSVAEKKVLEVTPEPTTCTCGHDSLLHYGGAEQQCNNSGCLCLALKK